MPVAARTGFSLWDYGATIVNLNAPDCTMTTMPVFRSATTGGAAALAHGGDEPEPQPDERVAVVIYEAWRRNGFAGTQW